MSLIAFPTADLFGRKINDFDLIIFDRYSNQTLLPSVYFDNIVAYVENGGAFLAAVGPDYATLRGLYYSPLESILPARPDGALFEQAFRAHVSKDGEKHPVTRGLEGSKTTPPSWGEWFRQVNTNVLKGDSVLLGAEDKPLVVLSREGKGRVGMLLTDQLWLWARGFEGGGPHVDLMRRMAHWLMKEPELEEEALRATASGHEILVERQSLKDETPPVTVTAPSGAREEIALERGEPGLSRARFHGEGDGALSLRERRPDGAGQCRPGQSARISRGGVDPGKAAPARPGDRRHRAAAFHRRLRTRLRCRGSSNCATPICSAAPTGSA